MQYYNKKTGKRTFSDKLRDSEKIAIDETKDGDPIPLTLQQALDKFHARPFSWSQMSSFLWSPQSWYDSYILDKKQDSEELRFGSYVDRRIQTDPFFIPKLPRYPLLQHKMKVVFDGITLVGIPDGLDLIKKLLADYKTGKNEWTIKKAKETGQLKFYLLLIYITEKINPEEFTCFIHWLPTQVHENGSFERTISLIDENDIKTFKVKHTMSDILNFSAEIKSVYKQMEQYIAEQSR